MVQNYLELRIMPMLYLFGSMNVNWAKLRPITRKVILSWLLPLPGLLRMPRPLDVSGVGGDGFWTQRTGLASPGRQVSLKWESSSSLVFSPSWLNEKHVSPSSTSSRLWHHSTKIRQVSLRYILSKVFENCSFVLPAKLPFSKSGTEDEGIGQASRLQNLRFFCEQLKPKSASERYQTSP